MAKASLRPIYQKVGGILFPPFPHDNIRTVLDYKPKPDDVFIATYPKCGTTWMQTIVLYIFRKGQKLENDEDFHKCCPFIDCKGMESIAAMPRPGAFKSHLPYTHMPYSPEAKYIYVLRNPKDCCVSMYYHTVRAHNTVYSEATFSDFFEIFMSGEVEYNDYFDHLMSWYPHRNDKQVLFTTYEDMKKDTKDIVLKVASFLGKEYTNAIEKDNNILNNILELSGFDYMQEHVSHQFCRVHKPKNSDDPIHEDKKIAIDQHPMKENLRFIRKGIVGDWMNHFSEEQNERMNKKFTARTQGTEIYDMYKPYILT